METYFIIYKTTCVITNRFYIGMHKTKNLQDGYLGSGKVLRNSINKYGRKNHIFEILEYLPDINSLIDKERQIVNEDLIKESLCMNLKVGGLGGGGFWNEEHRIKCQSAGGKATVKNLYSLHIEKLKDPIYKEKWLKAFQTDEKGINNSFYGRKHSQETLVKMRKAKESYKGEKHNQYGFIWICDIEKNTKKINPKDLDKYLNLGWVKGRKYGAS